jgi:ABC-2 type transport system permease protein
MPLLIFVNGKVSFGHIFGGYLGLVMLGMTSIAVGLFASSIAPNQLVAAVTGGAIMTAIFLCYLGARVAEPPLRDLLAFLSWKRHLAWQNGVLHTKDVFYFFSMTYFFLLLSTHVLQTRRWR